MMWLIAVIVTAILLALKIAGVTAVGWLVVFSPLLIVLGITLAFFALALLALIAGASRFGR